MPRILPCLLLIAASQVSAWDAAGHRLHAYLTFEFLSSAEQHSLYQILQHHPRYEEDFLGRMPGEIRNGIQSARVQWTLGQAAVWPDLARSLPEPERQRFDRPGWHWIDGRWMPPDGAVKNPIQGNVYLGRQALPDIQSTLLPTTDNMITAFEFSRIQLADPLLPEHERALALCWVLHLLGDIHQPLHAGALFSSTLFPNGDRGGNGITTDADDLHVGNLHADNLHASWDQALRGAPFDDSLQMLRSAAAEMRKLPELPLFASVQWLQESREILHTAAYTLPIREAVLHGERSSQALQRVGLDADYIANMHSIAVERIALASVRLAAVLNAALINASGPAKQASRISQRNYQE